MKWWGFIVLSLLSLGYAQQPFGIAVSGHYALGASVHLYLPVKNSWQARVTFGYTNYAERDRFAPELWSYGLGGDLLYDIATLDIAQHPLRFYGGGGFNIAYNNVLFAYRPFWSFRATPVVGIAFDLNPTIFLEFVPEVDFSPYFNVNAIDVRPTVRLGIVAITF
jgi:hypothetical protein